MASTYLTRTSSSAGTNTKGTFSAWVKRSSISNVYPRIIQIRPSSGNGLDMYFRNTDILEIKLSSGGSVLAQLSTNRLFRDVNAWYHILLSIDTTSGTADDRVRLYVNGVKETSFSTRTNPSQNADVKINGSSDTIQIGLEVGGSSNIFSGSMSHIHWLDGTAHDASYFGSTDSTTGEWKINTSPSVTYGTNGFFILKDGNSVTDQSGRGNNFTVGGGTLTKTEDCPSNVFATLNPLSFNTGFSLSNGNNYFNGGSVTSWNQGCAATMGASSGKYYWEVKWKNGTSVSIIGVLPIDQSYYTNGGSGSTSVYNFSNGWQLSTSGAGDKYNYVASTGAGFQRAHDDIIMFAMDMDNKKMWSGANGTWYSSGNPATGANPTWETSQFPTIFDNGFIPYCQSYNSGVVTEFAFNFGNGYFGSTQISSAGTNASGNGIFEYDVPANFTALSTKGLNL